MNWNHLHDARRLWREARLRLACSVLRPSGSRWNVCRWQDAICITNFCEYLMMCFRPVSTRAGPGVGEAFGWASFSSFLCSQLTHSDANCVSSHKDVANVFSKYVYFVRVGARGSLFTATLWFCNGCRTFSCWVKNRIELFKRMISFVCESFVTNQNRAGCFLVLFFPCRYYFCVCVLMFCSLCRNETDYCCQIKCLVRELHSVFVMNLNSCSCSLQVLTFCYNQGS